MFTQKELLRALAAINAPITAQTLRDRVKKGVVGPAVGGKGKPGRTVFWPEESLAENYVASLLMCGDTRITAAQVAGARRECESVNYNADLIKTESGKRWIRIYRTHQLSGGGVMI